MHNTFAKIPAVVISVGCAQYTQNNNTFYTIPISLYFTYTATHGQPDASARSRRTRSLYIKPMCLQNVHIESGLAYIGVLTPVTHTPATPTLQSSTPLVAGIASEDAPLTWNH